MLEYLVAASEPTFRFDTAALVEAARRAWPDAKISPPRGRLVGRVDAHVTVPSPAPPSPQLEFMTGGQGIGIDAPSREEAAEILAWLCGTAGIPDDGSVVVIHWADDVVPLHPGMTANELLQLGSPG